MGPGFLSHERLAYGPWPALERALARLIEHAGFSEVAVIGGPGDQGADVVGRAGTDVWLLQSKFRSSGGVGAYAAEEAVRAMTAYGARVAVAATNQFFHEDAFRYWQSAAATGIDLRLWDGDALLQYYRSLPSESDARRNLRDYQAEAVDAVEARRSAGEGAALVLMATGLGKSLVAGELIASELARNPDGEVLVLAHTVDLTEQLDRSMWSTLPKEVSTHLWWGSERPAYVGGVTFATWQSVLAGLDREPLTERYGLVIVDEAHHAGAEMYHHLISSLAPRFLVGLTATPWRGDKASLSTIFGEPAFSLDIVSGMQKGYLAEVDYRMMVDDIDWDEIRRLSRNGYSIRELNQRLILTDRDEAMVRLVAIHLQDLGHPKTIGFCRSIDHAERLQRLFLSENVSASVLHSKVPREQRFRDLSRFRRGDLNLLLAVDLLNEGIDVPDVGMVVFMRVTHSRRIFVQQLGRGLRLTPSKRVVRVLDFVADVRRLAAGFELNEEARQRGRGPEVLRFADGRIVTFSNDAPASFFSEYLGDVAAIEDMDDASKLAFPPA